MRSVKESKQSLVRTIHVSLGTFCHVFGSYRSYEGCRLFGKGHSKQAIDSSRYSRNVVIRAVTYKRQCALVLNERMKQPWNEASILHFLFWCEVYLVHNNSAKNSSKSRDGNQLTFLFGEVRRRGARGGHD